MNKYQKDRAQFIAKCERVKRADMEAVAYYVHEHGYISVFNILDKVVLKCELKDMDELLEIRRANFLVSTGVCKSLKRYYNEFVKK